MPEFYKQIPQEELKDLDLYQEVFVTSKERDLNRVKGIILERCSRHTTNIQICTNKLYTVSLSDVNDGEYGIDWCVELADGITVQTPLGLLHAHVIQDEIHPGIEIDLYPAGTIKPGKEPARLALTEFTEYESLCSFLPDEQALMLRELKEVPRKHIIHQDGSPLDPGEIPVIQNANKYRIKPTLITRAWPEQNDEDESYKRIFHED